MSGRITSRLRKPAPVSATSSSALAPSTAFPSNASSAPVAAPKSVAVTTPAAEPAHEPEPDEAAFLRSGPLSPSALSPDTRLAAPLPPPPSDPGSRGHSISRISIFPPQAQAKLAVSQPGDPAEQEAERVADQVMRTPDPNASASDARGRPFSRISILPPSYAPPVSRLGETAEQEAGPSDDATPAVAHALQGAGQPLDSGARSFLEPRLGHDLSRIRIHTDERASQSAEAVSALAYAVGADVVFRSGQYQPGTSAGRRLLAHELTHTIQQTGGAPLQRHVLPAKRDPASRPTDDEQAAPAQQPSAMDTAPANGAPITPVGPDALPAPGTAPAPINEAEFQANPPSAVVVEEKTEEEQPGPDAAMSGPTAPLAPTEDDAPKPVETTLENGPEETDEAGEDTEAAEEGAEEADEGTEEAGEGDEEAGEGTGAAGEDSGSVVESGAVESASAAEPGGQEGAGDAQVGGKGMAGTPGAAGPNGAGANAAPASEAAPPAPGAVRFASQQPKAVFAATEGALAAIPPEDILQRGADGVIYFQSENPESVQAMAAEQGTLAPPEGAQGGSPGGGDMLVQRKEAPGGAGGNSAGRGFVRQLPPAAATGLVAGQRAQAEATLGQFLAAGSARVAAMSALEQNIEPRIQSAVMQAQAQVDAALVESRSAVQAAIAQAQGRLQGEAQSAKSQVAAQHSEAIEAIQAATQTARLRIEAEYRAAQEQLGPLQAEIAGRVDDPFAKAEADFRAAGESYGQQALDAGQQRRQGYLAQPLPDTSKWQDFKNGSDYEANKRQARADAAGRVGEEYQRALLKDANDAAAQLPASKQQVLSGFERQFSGMSQRMESARTDALTKLTRSEQQSLQTANRTLQTQLLGIDQGLAAALGSLDQMQAAQMAQIAESGQQQKQTLAQSAEQAGTALKQGVQQGVVSLQGTLAAVAAEAQSMPAPSMPALMGVIAGVQGQIDGLIGQGQAQIVEGIASAEQRIAGQGQDTAAGLRSRGQEAGRQAEETVSGFAGSMAATVQGAAQSFEQVKQGHTQAANAAADGARSSYQSVMQELRQSCNTVCQNLTAKLGESVGQMENRLRATLGGIQAEITKKANEAAAQVQPRWKGWLKIAISVIVSIAVGIAIAALAASGVGLVAAIGLAALIGAAGKVLTRGLHDLVDGRLSSWQDYLKDAGIGAVTGVISLVGIRGADAALGRFADALANSPWVKKGVEMAAETVADTIADVTESVLSGEALTLEMVLKSVGVSLLFSGGAEGLKSGWKRLRGARGVDVPSGSVDVGGGSLPPVDLPSAQSVLPPPGAVTPPTGAITPPAGSVTPPGGAVTPPASTVDVPGTRGGGTGAGSTPDGPAPDAPSRPRSTPEGVNAPPASTVDIPGHAPDPALTNALPADLRSRVPVSVDPELPGNTVRVHYDMDKNGLVTNVHMRCGPDARPVDIELHARTARLMEGYSGLSGRARDLLNRLQRFIGLRGEPPVGSRAWEAKLEVEKLPRVIQERLDRLGRGGLDPEAEAALRADVDNLQAQLARHEQTLADMDADPGAGYVAAEARRIDANQLDANRPRLEEPPAGADPELWEKYVNYYNERVSEIRSGKSTELPREWSSYEEFRGPLVRGNRYQREQVTESLRNEPVYNPDGTPRLDEKGNPVLRNQVDDIQQDVRITKDGKTYYPDQLIVREGGTVECASNKSRDFANIQDRDATVQADVRELLQKYSGEIKIQRGPGSPHGEHKLFGQTVEVGKVTLVYDASLVPNQLDRQAIQLVAEAAAVSRAPDVEFEVIFR